MFDSLNDMHDINAVKQNSSIFMNALEVLFSEPQEQGEKKSPPPSKKYFLVIILATFFKPSHTAF